MTHITAKLDWEIQGPVSKGNVSKLPTYPGIYMVICVSIHNNECDPKTYELLYIGEAKNIKSRFEKKSDDEWNCLTENCDKKLLVKTAETTDDEEERRKIECCLINHNSSDLDNCQTECINNWPHDGDSVSITNTGSILPLKKVYECG